MSQHKTPLRYPGGKVKLAPFITEIMDRNGLVGGHYIEPYAGGAGVAIELLLSGKVSHIHLNDSCLRLYAFWRSVLQRTQELSRLIRAASLTVNEWRRQKEVFANPKNHCQLEVGFSALYLNRCNRSGIMGAGLIGGVNQDGQWKMDARFPRNELIRRIEAIASRKRCITVRNWDAERFITQYIPDISGAALVYCDPPYFHKGSRLYLNHYKPRDHARISKIIQGKLLHPWIVSYDSAPEIMECYVKRRSFLYQLQYNVNRAYVGTEVLFFSDHLSLPIKSAVPGINLGLQSLTV
ncbi:MAG: DNA adenine methylase [Nitrospira sp.]|nr:DNA adenine methylase [Nitrospira sp.]